MELARGLLRSIRAVLQQVSALRLQKLERRAQYFIYVDMPASSRVLVFINTLFSLEDEASSLLLSLPLAYTDTAAIA